MLENLNKTPRNFYGGTHRNFQVKRISKFHFLRSTLQALNSGLSRSETGLRLAELLKIIENHAIKQSLLGLLRSAFKTLNPGFFAFFWKNLGLLGSTFKTLNPGLYAFF